jgi:hypothetical protein
VVILIFAWSYSLKFLKNRSESSKINIVATPETPNISIPSQLPVKEMDKIEEEGQGWVRDPFSGKIYFAKEGDVSLVLTGIIWDVKNPQVLINNRILRKGSRIEKYQILDIQKDRVILSDGLKQIELKLH